MIRLFFFVDSTPFRTLQDKCLNRKISSFLLVWEKRRFILQKKEFAVRIEQEMLHFYSAKIPQEDDKGLRGGHRLFFFGRTKCTASFFAPCISLKSVPQKKAEPVAGFCLKMFMSCRIIS